MLLGPTNHQPRREHGQVLPDIRATKLIGVGVIVLALVVVALAYFKPNPLPRTTVRAYFGDASGIGVVGQQVRAAGVPVGEISDVQRVGDRALVTMKLDGGAPWCRRNVFANWAGWCAPSGANSISRHGNRAATDLRGDDRHAKPPRGPCPYLCRGAGAGARARRSADLRGRLHRQHGGNVAPRFSRLCGGGQWDGPRIDGLA